MREANRSSRTPLSLPLREILHRTLQQDEHAVWSARPILARLVVKWMVVVVAGLLVAAIGRLVLTNAAVRFYSLIGLPFAAVGLAGAISGWRRALTTAYVITDRRAMIISGGARAPSIRSFDPASLTRREITPRSDGTGTLLITRECHGEDYVDVGFMEIADVDGAEKALGALVQWASSQSRHYVNKKWGFELDSPLLWQIATEDANMDGPWPVAVEFVQWDRLYPVALRISISLKRNAGALLPGYHLRGGPGDLVLRYDPAGRPGTVDEFIARYKAAVGNQSHDYTFVSAEGIEVADCPAAMLIYAYEGTGRETYNEACVQPIDSPVAVQFVFSGPAAQWPELDAVFRRVLQSVKLGIPSQVSVEGT